MRCGRRYTLCVGGYNSSGRRHTRFIQLNTLKGKPKAGKEAFDVDFVKSMVKHGFTHGATWSTPDLMHFELRWRGPGQG
jgi:hypothetical protein